MGGRLVRAARLPLYRFQRSLDRRAGSCWAAVLLLAGTMGLPHATAVAPPDRVTIMGAWDPPQGTRTYVGWEGFSKPARLRVTRKGALVSAALWRGSYVPDSVLSLSGEKWLHHTPLWRHDLHGEWKRPGGPYPFSQLALHGLISYVLPPEGERDFNIEPVRITQGRGYFPVNIRLTYTSPGTLRGCGQWGPDYHVRPYALEELLPNGRGISSTGLNGVWYSEDARSEVHVELGLRTEGGQVSGMLLVQPRSDRPAQEMDEDPIYLYTAFTGRVRGEMAQVEWVDEVRERGPALWGTARLRRKGHRLWVDQIRYRSGPLAGKTWRKGGGLMMVRLWRLVPQWEAKSRGLRRPRSPRPGRR